MSPASRIFIALVGVLTLMSAAWFFTNDDHDASNDHAQVDVESVHEGMRRGDGVSTEAISASDPNQPRVPSSNEGIKGVGRLALAQVEERMRAARPWSGQVLDMRGRPLSGVLLALFRIPAKQTILGGLGGGLVEVDRVNSGDEGRFQGVVPLVPGLAYMLVAEAPGYQTTRIAPLDPLNDASLERTLHLPAAPEQPLVGRVLTTDGRPVPGARITASWRKDRSSVRMPVLDAAALQALSEDDGSFSLPLTGPAQAHYRLRVIASGFAAWERDSIVPARASKTGLDIELSEATSLTGSLRSPQGFGLAGWVVALSPSARGGSAAGRTNSIPEPRRIAIRADGVFEAHDLQPGRHRMSIEDRAGTVRARRSIELPADPIELTFEDKPVVAGRVLTREGEAVEHFHLAWSRLDDEGQPETGLTRTTFRALPEGGFVTAAPAEGSWRLHAKGLNGGAGVSAAINVDDRDVAGVDIEVLPGQMVVGRVRLDGSVDPLVGAAVALVPSAPENSSGDGSFGGVFTRPAVFSPAVAQTHPDGSFAIPNVEPGRYRVRVTHPGAVTWNSDPFFVELGEARDLETVYVSASGRVGGVVRDRAGKVDASAVVAASPAGSRKPAERLTVPTDGEGRFLFAGLNPGPWNIALIQSRGVLIHAASLTQPGVSNQAVLVTAGETVEVELEGR